MKYLALWLTTMFSLGLLGSMQQVPTPNPSPLPGHGPWEGKGVVCYRGDTQLDAKPKGRVHCDCKAPCDKSDAPDPGCMTKCDEKKSCVCHADECDGGAL